MRERTPSEEFGYEIARAIKFSFDQDWKSVEHYLGRALGAVSTILWNEYVSQEPQRKTPRVSVETMRRNIVEEVLST